MKRKTTCGNRPVDGAWSGSVRLLTAEEWGLLRQVRLAALADAPEAFGSTLARERARDEADWRRWIDTTACFAAFCEAPTADPCGIVAAAPRRGEDTAPPRADQKEWGLWSMWVSPGTRGSGVADRLVFAAVGHAAAAGASRITLWVADGNDRARRFYLRMGFQPTGERQIFRRDDGSELGEEALALEVAAAR